MYLLTISLRKLCNGSKKWTWSIQWMNKSPREQLQEQFFNFELMDARIASAMNRSIHNFHFKRRVSLEEQKAPKEDRFLRGRQNAYPIYENFWVTGANDSVEDFADLFTIGLRNADIQEFDSKWDGILLSMTIYHLMISWKVCTN